MVGFECLKSVGGGGRYDALASDGRTTYPGVGISFGVSRSLVPLIDPRRADQRPQGARASSSWPSSTRSRGRPATRSPRRCARNGVPCEVAAGAQKFGKQIRYAERRGIPYVWFTGADGGHEVKDIRSGEQVAADPATWTPPAEDLRPRVMVSTGSTQRSSSTPEEKQ